ncbi:hypothetical protein FMM05_11765 [Flavobacterium zepuense]|uniref:Uncharacterized protein n=1 Tax=Flavobacterium zepuense TaxID=2593302 RepID=A0A552V038_9FLAO|nr:hypothetical protein [Flavobacterium zepuense]TRW23833.1 hypothetical protein FMM05_11765 [Flavobacterium zepuense]
MRTFIIVALTALLLYGYKIFKFLKNNVKKIEKVPFKEQLEIFKAIGFKINKEIPEGYLLSLHDTTEYENNPYNLLYLVLGSFTEDDSYAPITNNCWHFDAECINDHGDYATIIENIGRISNGELNFKNVKDYVDIEEMQAWVSFVLNDDAYKWNFKVDDDWVDGAVFENLQNLTEKYQTKGRFTNYGLGQDCIIGYLTNSQFAEFKQRTNLDIQWLEGSQIN